MAGGREFVFDEHGMRSTFSNAVMLEDLRRYASAHGWVGFTMAAFDAWEGRRCGAATIRQRFGGWRRAQWAAGISSARRGKYSPAELMEKLEEVWREVGRPPGMPTLRKMVR